MKNLLFVTILLLSYPVFAQTEALPEIDFVQEKISEQKIEHVFTALYGENDSTKEMHQDVQSITAKLAIDYHHAFPMGVIELLPVGHQGCVQLSKLQTATLLSLSYYNTFTPKSNYPVRNFSNIFNSFDREVEAQKLKGLFDYFLQLKSMDEKKMESIQISFCRHSIKAKIFDHQEAESFLYNSTKEMIDFEIILNKRIEDDPQDHLVDFANASLGGGVIDGGSAQEEILFVARPDLIAGTLIFEQLEDDEAITISGAPIVNDFSGYGKTLHYNGPYHGVDNPNQTIIAIDAFDYRYGGAWKQYQQESIERELLKALTGFSAVTCSKGQSLSSGKWGCGVFKGNTEMKLFIQWIAASQAGHNIKFHLNENEDQEVIESYQSIAKLISELRTADHNLTVGRLYGMVVNWTRLTQAVGLVEYISQGLKQSKQKEILPFELPEGWYKAKNQFGGIIYRNSAGESTTQWPLQ